MKHCITLLACLFCSAAQAATYEKPNKAGGQIVLTERKGACTNNMLAAYATAQDGDVLFGCWGMSDGRIFLIIRDQVNVHEPSSFTRKGEAAKPAAVTRGM